MNMFQFLCVCVCVRPSFRFYIFTVFFVCYFPRLSLKTDLFLCQLMFFSFSVALFVRMFFVFIFAEMLVCDIFHCVRNTYNFVIAFIVHEHGHRQRMSFAQLNKLLSIWRRNDLEMAFTWYRFFFFLFASLPSEALPAIYVRLCAIAIVCAREESRSTY